MLNMIPTGLNTPHPLPARHSLYILYFDTGKRGVGGGGVEPERVGKATVHKAERKIPT